MLALLVSAAFGAGAPSAAADGTASGLPFGEAGPSGQDVPVVLSASRLRQPLDESPAAVTIIDRSMIELSGARTVVDLLHLVPGFQVNRRLVGNPVAAYHGLADRYNPHLQLLVDGRPTFVPLFGGVPWHELPVALEDIERIEVTRAPNAATFGPNSFSSVVNITTREPAADAGWRGSVEAGGNRFTSGVLSHHGSSGASDYRLSVRASDTEGYENLPDTARSRLATFRTVHRLDARDRLTLDVGALRGGHIELDPIENPDQFAPYEETTNLYAQLVWERARSSDDSWRVQYYHNRYDIDDSGRYAFDFGQISGNETFSGTLFEVDLDRDSRSARHELEVQRTARLSPGHRIVYGAAARHDRVQSRYVFDDERTHVVDTQRLFAHSELEARRDLVLQSGLMLQHDSLTGGTVAPRASLIWRVAPGQRLRLGYSRGLRTPGLLEEEGEVVLEYELQDGSTRTDHFIFQGPTIEPETNDVFELGYHLTTRGRAFTLDAQLSHQRIRELITTRRAPFPDDTFDGEARDFRNRFDYAFSSLDLQIDRVVSRRLMLRASYSHAFGLDRDLDRLELTPRHTLSLFGGYRPTPTLSLSGELYFVSDWIWDDVRDVTNTERLDLRIARRFGVGGVAAEFAVQAELELGENIDYLERNEVDDRYFAKLSVRFH